MSTPAIAARDIVVIHRGSAGPVAALRGLDVTVAPGEIAVIVGPSGSGKSSFLRVVSGLARPSAGTLSVLGRPLENASDRELDAYRRATIGIVEQHYRRALSPYAPIEEVIAMPLAVRGVPPRERRARVDELLGAIGLADRRTATARELSGGEQQRTAVAAALSTRPRLLVADEPTGELDPRTSSSILSLIRELARASGATALIVTHDPALEDIADRVIVLQDGRAVAERPGPPGTTELATRDGAGWQAPPKTWRDAPREPGPLRSAGGGEAGDDGTARAPAVLIERVTRRYGSGRRSVPALSGVSARIPVGGLHAIVGPSGSGKSTLVRLVAGLDRPDDGRITVHDDVVTELDRGAAARFRAEHVGIAEQARGLVPFLTAAENVALALEIRAAGRRPAAGSGILAGDGARSLVDDALSQVGLEHLAGRRPAELSAGERTRVAIARAIVGGPRLLVLDEPTATLDRVAAGAIARLAATLGSMRTVIVATHDPALIAAADTILELAGSGTA